MKLKTGNKTAAVTSFAPSRDGCGIVTTEPVTVGAVLTVTDDTGVLLRGYAVADYLRCVVDGCSIRLTNTPEPVPVEPPPHVPTDSERLAALEGAVLAMMEVPYV